MDIICEWSLAKGADHAGVSVVPALKVSKKEGNTWNRRPLDQHRLQVVYCKFAIQKEQSLQHGHCLESLLPTKIMHLLELSTSDRLSRILLVTSTPSNRYSDFSESV